MSCLLVLNHSRTIPKSLWRQAGTRRLLPAISLDAGSCREFTSHQGRTVLTGTLALDGSFAVESVKQVRDRGCTGVFDLWWEDQDRIRLTLNVEACRIRLGAPVRTSRSLGWLTPWQPLRVSLNGRYGSYSGQFYQLRDYYLLHCAEPPEDLHPVRRIDLQADLF